MANRKYSDAQTIELFMDSFHKMSERDYWKRLRTFSSRLDDFGSFEVEVNQETGRVRSKVVPVEAIDVTLAASHVRQFMVNSDPVRLDDVFRALDRIGLESSLISDAKDQWDQLHTDRLPFQTLDGDSVGVILADKYVTWEKGGPARIATKKYPMSLIKFADTMFHEGLFHPFEPGIKSAEVEQYRRVARTVPKVWSERFVNAALASTIFAVIMFHDQIGRLSTQWSCAEECWERRHMDLRWTEYDTSTNFPR